MSGTIHQRSKGTWRIRYSLARDASGRRKHLTETVKGTKAEAQAVLRDRLTALATGNYVEKDRETVAEFMDRLTCVDVPPDRPNRRGHTDSERREIEAELGIRPDR